MSAGCLSNVCPSSSSSPYKMIIHEDHNPIQKQGFLAVLNTTTTPEYYSSLSSSLKRTFSADMLAPNPNGFSSNSLKRAQSSEQLDFLGKDDDHDHQGINNNNSSDEKKGAFEDIWSSIQKNGGSGSGDLPPPYVHPLLKRSASLLSQKSLEVCTESLGSETGSETGLDGLSDPGGFDHKDGESHAHQQGQEFNVMMINHIDDHPEVGATKCTKLPSLRRTSSSPPAVVPMTTTRSSFPPPLPSLSHREGSNLHMRSHRRDGRLVLEAVAVPSVNRLRAQRHDGRLLLTLANDVDINEPTLEDDDEEAEITEDQGDELAMVKEGQEKDDDRGAEDEEGEEEEEEENELEKKLAIVMEANTRSFKTTSSSSLIMSKLLELTTTKNKSAWPRSFNTTIVKTVLEDEATLAKSHLPPRPVRLVSAASGPTSTATVLNAYEYYWRRGNSGSTVAVLKPLAGHQKNNAAGPQVVKDVYRNQLLLAHKGKSQEVGGERDVVLVKPASSTVDGVEMEKGGLKAEEYLVPLLRGCKEPRRRSSLLFWDSEPYCIATS